MKGTHPANELGLQVEEELGVDHRENKSITYMARK